MEYGEKELFEFANRNPKADENGEYKSHGYLYNSYLRLKSKKTSLISALIIIGIILFGILVPFFYLGKSNTMNSYYAKKPPRIALFDSEKMIIGGTRVKNYNPKSYIKLLAIGIGSDTGKDVELANNVNNNWQNPIKNLRKHILFT